MERAGQIADADGWREGEDGFGFEHDGLLDLCFGLDCRIGQALRVDAEMICGVWVVEGGGEAADGGGCAVGEVEDETAHGAAVFATDAYLDLHIFVQDTFGSEEQASVTGLPALG